LTRTERITTLIRGLGRNFRTQNRLPTAISPYYR